MTVIKNTAKLVKRAEDHREADNIINGMYMEMAYEKITNGETIENMNLSVCAIGCLATEVESADIFKQFDVDVDDFEKKWIDVEGKTHTDIEIDIGRDHLVKLLEEDFGICSNLAAAAEFIFEADGCDNPLRNYNDGDMDIEDWPVEFAKALNEGADITNEEVRDFWDNNLRRDDENAYVCQFSYMSIASPIAKDTPELFLNWLRSRN